MLPFVVALLSTGKNPLQIFNQRRFCQPKLILFTLEADDRIFTLFITLGDIDKYLLIPGMAEANQGRKTRIVVQTGISSSKSSPIISRPFI